MTFILQLYDWPVTLSLLWALTSLVKVHLLLPHTDCINSIISLTSRSANDALVKCIHEYVLLSTLLKALFSQCLNIVELKHQLEHAYIISAVQTEQPTFELFHFSSVTISNLYYHNKKWQVEASRQRWFIWKKWLLLLDRNLKMYDILPLLLTSVTGAVKSWCNMISALVPRGLIPPFPTSQMHWQVVNDSAWWGWVRKVSMN